MKIRFLIILLLTTVHHLWAVDVVELSDKSDKIQLLTNQYVEVYEDTTALQGIETVSLPSFLQKYKPVSYTHNVRPTSAYWLKITVRNNGSPFTHYVLENSYLHTEDFSIYFLEKGTLHQQSTSEFLTYPYRDYQHKNLVLDFPVPPKGEVRTYYIRVYSALYVNMNFTLKNQHYFNWYSNNEYLLLGIYYGIIFLLILYNFILFITVKSRVYLLYILYLLSGTFLSLNEDKLGYQYLWPETPSLNSLFAFHLAPTLLVVCFILYASEFLDLHTKAKGLFYAVWISFAAYVALFLLNFYYPVFVPMRICTPIPFFVIFLSSIVLYSKGQKSARFFILGSGLIVSSIVLIQLRASAIIMGSIFTVYLFNYSLIIESIILSFALSDKIKLLREDKDRVQQSMFKKLKENERLQQVINQQLSEKQQMQERINQELEIKVAERTKELSLRSGELEETNAKLASIIEQTNNMNIRLDLDNWELKKNVRHELVQRITGQEVSINMFKTVFKDDTTCLRFLEELKWNGGFVCKKCGYTKYKEIEYSFMRKCSKCSHPESATAGTLLHGIKFSIHHALYLIYLIHARKGELKLEEISAISGISLVSASKFRAKTIERMKQVEKRRKNATWEEILLN